MVSGVHRKVVTVLFCDVVGSTALGESVDPEVLEGLLARYFERMKGIVDSHGGTVEKFIGDAVMAVFGVPVTHEDDALRACRAATEMRDALPEVGLEGRIGLNTGEVLAGIEERLATGDAVNVAARLEQAAEPGEVLIGAKTLGLVNAAVEVGAERWLELKGKSEPVAAYPLVAVREAEERSHASRFVGRERELRQLADVFERARTGLRCEMVTVVGDPGVGKSRLVAEALAEIDARVVRGRCVSYGEGITYWPVVEVVKQLNALPSEDLAAKAIRSLLGEGEVVAGSDEIAWAFRKLLEEQAPLVVCFDDIQWGEQTFLDLVESIALLSTGASLLLICMARPELLDRHPAWPAIHRLEPLLAEEAKALVGDGVGERVREQIVHASGGNPLFLTEMVALSEASGGEVEVPPTLRALLAARLDQLDEAERRVLECGAVEGELFHRGTVQALAPEESEVTPRLAALVRRDLVRPDRPQFPGDDAYRFRHLLIRDAAYEALPKAARAELHERLAVWLEERGRDLVELDEILGYHLEQAYRLRRDLGAPDQEMRELALRAALRLASAGRRAHARTDATASCALLERATELLPEGHPSLPELLELLGYSYFGAAQLGRGRTILAQAQTAANAKGQRTVELRARMSELVILVLTDHEQDSEATLREAQAAIVELQPSGDFTSLARAWHAVTELAWLRSDLVLLEEAATQRLQLAQQTGLVRDRLWAAFWLTLALAHGPTPVEWALPRAEEALAELSKVRVCALNLALLYAYAGRHGQAKETIEAAKQTLLEPFQRTHDAMNIGAIAMLSGHPEDAEPELRSAAEALTEVGGSEVARVAAVLAELLYQLGRNDEAEDWTRQSEKATRSEQVISQAQWRATRAKVFAKRGEADQAVRLATEGLDWARRGNDLPLLGDCLSAYAEVLRALGRTEEAMPFLYEALAAYKRKGILPAIEHTHTLLGQIPA